MKRVLTIQDISCLGKCSLTIALPVMNLATAFGTLVGAGAAALTSIRLGERENEKAQVNDRIVAATLALTVVVYVLTCVLEAFFPQVMPIEVLSVSICSWLKISLGCISAVALFVSGYYGSLSIERKAHDHRRMSMLFERAAEVYEREPETRRELFKRLAREEIIENGTWMSYCNENRPTFNL